MNFELGCCPLRLCQIFEVRPMSDLNPAERAALTRFERARNAGAAERTALNLAAWAWIEQRPNDPLPLAIKEVARVVRRGHVRHTH